MSKYIKCECGKLVNKQTMFAHKCIKSANKKKPLNHKASSMARMISAYQ